MYIQQKTFGKTGTFKYVVELYNNYYVHRQAITFILLLYIYTASKTIRFQIPMHHASVHFQSTQSVLKMSPNWGLHVLTTVIRSGADTINNHYLQDYDYC